VVVVARILGIKYLRFLVQIGVFNSPYLRCMNLTTMFFINGKILLIEKQSITSTQPKPLRTDATGTKKTHLLRFKN
jgi:hypothetical protein